jgi:hypothetical protein
MKQIALILVFVISLPLFTYSQVINRDEKTVTVTAQGWGKRVGDTKLDAMRTGLETVINEMLTTPLEKIKFQEQKQMLLANAEKYIFDYYIKRKIQQKGKQRGQKYKLIMTLELTVNKEELRKELESLNIIASSMDLRKKLDNFTLMPYVDEKKSSRAFLVKKDLVYAKIGSYLQNQHIPFIGEEEIKSVEQNEEIINLEKSGAADGGEEDLMLQLARNTTADFYIKIVGHVNENHVGGAVCYKVNLSVTVYTVMTGENIASQTGYSRPLSLSSPGVSIAVGIEEAVNGAMNDVMDKLRLFWKDYVRDGRPYKLVFYDYPFNEIGQIRRVLKAMTTRIKLIKRVGNVASFMVWYDGQMDDLLFEVPGRMELNVKEPPTTLGNTIRFFRKQI